MNATVAGSVVGVARGILGVLLLFPATLPAQARRLTTPEARYPESFDLIAGLRELSTGRVLVADGIGEVVVSLDASLSAADTLGRKGKGPGEYTLPDRLLPLPGDRTLLLDLGNGRMTTIEADGSFGESRTIAKDNGSGFSIIMPRASDDRGRLYYQPMGDMGGGFPDSAAIVRLMPGDPPVADTVARVRLQAVKTRTSGSANNRSISMNPVPFSPRDAWAVAPDGSVALARSGTGANGMYRLDWVLPDGSTIHGPVVSYRPVRIGRAEQQEFFDQMDNGLGISISDDNGRRNISFGRNGGRRSQPDPAEYQWPRTKPAFPRNAVNVTPTGEVWVRLSTSAGEPWRFDVFDARGNRTGEIVLPPDRRLVGFGRGVVYLVMVDEDGLQWLERYRL